MSTQFVETTNRETAFYNARRYQNTMKKNRPAMPSPTMKTALPIEKIGDSHYCKSVDVHKLIHHEMMETDNPAVLAVLRRMESRLVLGEIYDPDKTLRNYSTKVPGRYAVGYKDGNGWHFYAGARNDHSPVTTDRPCEAKLYDAYRGASACADFIDDDHDWQVLDWYENLTEEERWRRTITMPFPYDLDEGCEDSTILTIVN